MSRSRNKRVLLLEPNKLLAEQCINILSRRGYQVTWCKNAQDGINEADRINPDAIILELLLTAHSGVEFLYEFRSYTEWRETPVVLFSRISRAELPATDKSLHELGVTTYFYKPSTPLIKLADRIDLLVKGKVTVA